MGLSHTFSVHHLETVDDVEQYLELMRRVFGEKSRVDLMVKKWINHHPSMTLDDFFVIKHLGNMVAGLCLIPSEWSIGEIRVKVAELGCVGTLPEYRYQGLQRKLMEEYDKRVLEHGYYLSVIQGIPYFYRQFGYEYAIPLDEQTIVRFEKIPDYERVHTIRPLANSDIWKAMELLERSQRKFYVHSVRDKGIWKMQQEAHMAAEYDFEGYSVEKEGQMIAYFRLSQNPENKELFLREITDVDQSGARSVLNFLKEKGLRLGLETLVCTISRHEPFVEHLIEAEHAEQPRSYAWQIRVTDCVKMLLKMKSLFEKRLQTSSLSCMTGKISLNFYRYAIQLTIDEGAIIDVQRLEESGDRTVRFNPTVFTQLLLGHRSREELELVYPDFIVRPSHRLLIDTLFPRLLSYVHTVC
jgi:predicted acetyltransferase